MESISSLNHQLPALQASEERFAQVDGSRMRYLFAGSGRPLVLLHGLMGYSFSWRFNLPALSACASVYAVDQLGTGYSDRPAHLNCRLRSVAERVLKFVRAVGISSFDLLGTSHGGAVAMMAAALARETPQASVERLILVAPVNPWSEHGRKLAPLLGSPLGSALFRHSVRRLRWAFPYLLDRLYGDPKRIAPGTLEGYAAPVLSLPGSWEYGLSIVRHWTEDLQELRQTIPRLRTLPALLLWGSADLAVYASSAEPLRRQFDHCRIEIFPGVGHLPYEEVPQQFNRAVIEFLTRTPPR